MKPLRTKMYFDNDYAMHPEIFNTIVVDNEHLDQEHYDIMVDEKHLVYNIYRSINRELRKHKK